MSNGRRDRLSSTKLSNVFGGGSMGSVSGQDEQADGGPAARAGKTGSRYCEWIIRACKH